MKIFTFSFPFWGSIITATTLFYGRNLCRKYYGCPCEGCGQPLTLRDDIVVCPDCGAPYHRTCYEKLGRCIHSPAHAAGYEWKFPYQENELRTCPSCGERTLRSEEYCRCCGAKLPPEGAEQPNDRAEEEQNFDYASFYRQFEEGNVPDPLKEAYQAAFGKEEQMGRHLLQGLECLHRPLGSVLHDDLQPDGV